MAIFQQLSVLALRNMVEGARGVIGVHTGERAVEGVVSFLTNHFTDHSQNLTNAMLRANDNAWRSLEIALAGESLWNWLDTADNKAFRKQVRTFLDAASLDGLSGHGPEFRRGCLKELREAREKGLLSGSLEPNSLAQQVGQFAAHSDPNAILDAEWKSIQGMCEIIQSANYPALAHLINLRASGTGDTPLLVISVRFFFRREIENDQKLYQGLSWAKFEMVKTTQEQAFAGLHEVLVNNHGEVQSMLESVQAVVVETHGVVVDIQKEVMNLARRMDLMHRELRPKDSLSISNEAERQLVKQLVSRYRALPEEQRKEVPSLLNAIGKLQVAAGSFDSAQQDFLEAAQLAKDKADQAEAHYNLFGTALEKGDYDAALVALKKAVELHPGRFAPFPVLKYEPEKILGAGGFGTAFLCRNRHSGSQIVVKTIRSDSLDREMKDVFQEARLLEELDHPAIIRIRDCDYADGAMTRPFIVMDYFEGGSLEDYVEEQGTIAPNEILDVISPVAYALLEAHKKGILHRDIKPGNLLVRRGEDGEWRVKLIDFGLALKQDVLQSTVSQTNKTIAGYSIAGTLDYAAPEQMGKLQGVPVGTYTDVYGLAKTICYALFKTVQPLRKHWQELPELLADLLEKCLSEHPQERLPDFEKFLEHLGKLQGPSAPAAAPWVTSQPSSMSQTMEQSQGADTKQMHRPAFWKATQDFSKIPNPVARLEGHEDAVLSLAISPDGQQILSSGADKTVRLWDVESGEEIQCLQGHTDRVWKALFFRDGQLAASASQDKSLRLWDLATGRELRTYPNRTNGALAVSPDELYALTGNITDGMIRFAELESGRELRRLKGHMAWVLSLAFFPNGQRAISSSADGTLRIWDINMGRELKCLQGHKDQVWSVSLSLDGQKALSTSADKTMRLWNLRTNKETHCFANFNDQVWNAVFSPDGHLGLSDGDDGMVCLWDLESGNSLPLPKAHNGKVQSVAYSPDGHFFVSGGVDKGIVVWKF